MQHLPFSEKRRKSAFFGDTREARIDSRFLEGSVFFTYSACVSSSSDLSCRVPRVLANSRDPTHSER